MTTGSRRTKGTGKRLTTIGTCCGALATVANSARAQDALQLSLGNQTAATQRLTEFENQPYTVRWGEFKLLTKGSITGEWNNNVDLARFSPERDFIIRPLANFDAFWPVTELNAFTFSLGVGYEKYLRHSAYDRPLITPGSILAWNIFAKNVSLNFHDRFSYSENPIIYGGVSGTPRFGGFNNTIGSLLTWDLNDVILSFGYDHANFISSTSFYEYSTYASDFGLVRAAFKVHPSATAGLEASGGPTTYEQRVLSDNVTYSLGGFATWRVSEHITAAPRVGYYSYTFANEGQLGRGSSQGGLYFSFRIDHDVTQKIAYSLDGGREALTGNSSALTEQWHAAANIKWRVIEHIALSTSVSYENATQLFSQLSADYERTSAAITLDCPLKEKLLASLHYSYWVKDSAQTPLYNYEQNLLSLQLSYRF